MSLRAKKTKWRRNLRARAGRIIDRLNVAWKSSSLSQLADILNQELGTVAAHYYKLGREAGIAEGRRRQAEDR